MGNEFVLDEAKNTSTQKSVKKSVHDGHRKRLTELALRVGMENLSDVQVVELFLFHIFPRGDTNPLAHRLLQEFGDFAHIIEAEPEDLVRVKGINLRSAQAIASFRELDFYLSFSRLAKKTKICKLSELVDAFEDILRYRTTEYMLFLAFSATGIVTHKKIVSIKSSDQVGFSTFELTRFISNAKPAMIAMGHCHPYGRALPSKADDQSFARVSDICRSCGVNLIDSFIVGEEGVFSQKRDKIVRNFRDDIDELKEVLQSGL